MMALSKETLAGYLVRIGMMLDKQDRKRRIERWNSYVSLVNDSGRGVDLSGQTIAHKNSEQYLLLEGISLVKVNARGTEFRGVDLSGAFLNEGDFRGAQMREACLEGICAIETDFREADLSYANFSHKYGSWNGTELGEADFRKAKLQHAQFEGSLVGADFRGADLQDASFDGASLKETKGIFVFGPVLQGEKVGFVYEHDGMIRIQYGVINATRQEMIRSIRRALGRRTSEEALVKAACRVFEGHRMRES